MSESGLWRVMRPKLQPFGNLMRVENAVEEGVADVHYNLRHPVSTRERAGWVELKELDSLPARAHTHVMPAKLTREQALWLGHWDGMVLATGLLLRVQDTGDYHYFRGSEVIRFFDSHVSREDLYKFGIFRTICHVHSPNKFPTFTVLEWLLRLTTT